MHPTNNKKNLSNLGHPVHLENSLHLVYSGGNRQGHRRIRDVRGVLSRQDPGTRGYKRRAHWIGHLYYC